MSRLSSISCAGSRPKIATTTPTFQSILASKPPWGRYSANSWVIGTNTLTDLTGNGRHATTSGVTNFAASGNGAAANIAYLDGTTTSTILWPAGSIPATYTMCSITRYASSVSANQQRTLCSSSNNWLHGHHGSKRGVAFNAATWRTAQTSTGTMLDWLNFCATSSATAPTNVLIDGSSAGLAVGGGGVSMAACINLCPGGEQSNFQFSQLIIWDQELTATEMATVAAALNTYLATNILQ